MLKTDLIPQDFNYKEYVLKNDLLKLVGMTSIPDNISEKVTTQSITAGVDPNNKIPYPPEFDDLSRLHYITCSRKVTTILEFGVGKSTPIFGDALSVNKKKYYQFTSSNLRRANLYECHSIDNNQSWIDECKSIIPQDLISQGFLHLHLSKLFMSEFTGRICTLYDPLPNIAPDLIYLDAPHQFSPTGDIRGLSTRHFDRLPMSADILSFEHFLHPGTLIIVDGRTANARFLLTNLQREWSYYYSEEWDQHFFELQEKPLGVYNKRMLEHCLGNKYFQRISNSSFKSST